MSLIILELVIGGVNSDDLSGADFPARLEANFVRDCQK
jgi:hypothetical protein